MMQSLWKKLVIAAMVCGSFGLMSGTSEAAVSPAADYLSLSIPGQIQPYDLTVSIDGISMEEKLSPAERRRIQRERWERERRRREMERRRHHHHRPPPPPPRRRHWSADIAQTADMFQLPNGSIAETTK